MKVKTSHSIPFSPAMILALGSDLKTQTRRIIKPQPPEWVRQGFVAHGDLFNFTNGQTVALLNAPCAVHIYDADCIFKRGVARA
jgi:hypothetical protein